MNLEGLWSAMHFQDVDKVRHAITTALDPDGSAAIDCEFRLSQDAGSPEQWIRMNGKAFFEGTGKQRKAVRLVNTVQDISDRKQWEISQKLLLGELSHRIKNMLSVVQAMAHQTLRGSSDEGALNSFEARLHALGKAHELLMDSNWRGTDLADLIQLQLEPHVGVGSRRITADGPAVTLPPRMTAPFGLLLHELATNALKHGSLRDAKGSVQLTWQVSARKGDPLLRLRWEEKDGPPIAKTARNGFGSYLIDQGISEATVTREFPSTGMICTIEMPLKGTNDP